MTLLPNKRGIMNMAGHVKVISREQQKEQTAVQAYVSVQTSSTLVVMLFSSGEREYGIGEGKEIFTYIFFFLSSPLPFFTLTYACNTAYK